MSDKKMDALGEEIIRWAAKNHPEYATYIGIHDYDHLLADTSMTAFKKEIKQLKEFMSRVNTLKPSKLSADRRIDRDYLLHTLKLILFDAEELKTSESYPFAPSDFGTAIMLLFNRDFAPLPDRLRSISSRFTAAPKYFQDARERMLHPIKMWIDIGIESCTSLPGMLKLIENVAKQNLPPPEVEQLANAATKAGEALASHGAWLKDTIRPKAIDEIGIGTEKLDELVALRGLGFTTDEIYALGKDHLAKAKEQLKVLASQIKPGATVEDAKIIVKSKHPKDFPEALSMTVKAMTEAKDFIVEKNLATFPPKEELTVIETPEYLRHVMPIAAYMPSAPFDPVQQGVYMVTPVNKTSDELKKHNYAKTWITAVHEGYPGHHLHNSCAASNKSIARRFQWSIETVEGWALYCEEMMMEKGFHVDPETKFSQTLDLIWRACRVIIDIDLHRRRMTFDQAVEMLMTEAGLDKPTATAEVKRYTYTPAYPLSYLLGKHMIMDLKGRAMKGWGERYSDKLFHDTFLYAGLIPMSLINRVFEQKFEETS